MLFKKRELYNFPTWEAIQCILSHKRRCENRMPCLEKPMELIRHARRHKQPDLSTQLFFLNRKSWEQSYDNTLKFSPDVQKHDCKNSKSFAKPEGFTGGSQSSASVVRGQTSTGAECGVRIMSEDLPCWTLPQAFPAV